MVEASGVQPDKAMAYETTKRASTTIYRQMDSRVNKKVETGVTQSPLFRI